MEIRKYNKHDRDSLFQLMKNEGGEWSDYYDQQPERYRAALENSITYVICEENEVCGFCRCRDDDGFGIYIYDLLVDKKHRGKQLGHQLMSQVCFDFPGNTIYVMSDVDAYYKKQGYQQEGSIFQVISSTQ